MKKLITLVRDYMFLRIWTENLEENKVWSTT